MRETDNNCKSNCKTKCIGFWNYTKPNTSLKAGLWIASTTTIISACFGTYLYPALEIAFDYDIIKLIAVFAMAYTISHLFCSKLSYFNPQVKRVPLWEMMNADNILEEDLLSPSPSLTSLGETALP